MSELRINYSKYFHSGNSDFLRVHRVITSDQQRIFCIHLPFFVANYYSVVNSISRKKLSILVLEPSTFTIIVKVKLIAFIVSHGVMFNHSQNVCNSNIICESKPAVNVMQKRRNKKRRRNTQIPMNHSQIRISPSTLTFLKVHDNKINNSSNYSNNKMRSTSTNKRFSSIL